MERNCDLLPAAVFQTLWLPENLYFLLTGGDGMGLDVCHSPGLIPLRLNL